ncbi:hypothetical protein BDR22DRAFT_887848 [Usnea florida]
MTEAQRMVAECKSNGDYCPPQYKFPPDWDVLSQLRTPTNPTPASLIISIPVAHPGTAFTPLNNPAAQTTINEPGNADSILQIAKPPAKPPVMEKSEPTLPNPSTPMSEASNPPSLPLSTAV